MNRNLSRRRTAFSLALAMLALACMVPFAIGVFAAEGEADYVAPLAMWLTLLPPMPLVNAMMRIT